MDVFTITDELPGFKKVCFFGDTEFARTVHSLEILLKNTFPEVEIAKINTRAEFDQKNALNLADADVVYMTRLQRERSDVSKNAWIQLNPLAYMKEKSMLLHPLPRAGELSVECDADPRAAYWRQVKNGLYLRMALLKMILRP
jgi:aspartate carbamoyltransferase catalytic subunit